jgi:hypothetical protein
MVWPGRLGPKQLEKGTKIDNLQGRSSLSGGDGGSSSQKEVAMTGQGNL